MATTATQIGDRVYDELKDTPWPDYYCAITAMAHLVYELYGGLLAPEDVELSKRSLRLAQTTASGEPAEPATVAEIVAEWHELHDTQTGYVHECIATARQLFGTVAMELNDDRAHYAARQWI